MHYLDKAEAALKSKTTRSRFSNPKVNDSGSDDTDDSDDFGNTDDLDDFDDAEKFDELDGSDYKLYIPCSILTRIPVKSMRMFART